MQISKIQNELSYATVKGTFWVHLSCCENSCHRKSGFAFQESQRIIKTNKYAMNIIKGAGTLIPL